MASLGFGLLHLFCLLWANLHSKKNMDLKHRMEERKCGGEERLGAGEHLRVFPHWQCEPGVGE